MICPRIAIFAVAAVFSVPALGQTNSEQQCIFAAAEKLPKIAGLSISASRAKAMPEVLRKDWQLQYDRYKGFVGAQGANQRNPPINVFMVDIEARAAAQVTLFSFICFHTMGLPSVIYAMNAGK